MIKLLSKFSLFLFTVNCIWTDYCSAAVRPVQKSLFYSQASQDQFIYNLLYELCGKQDKGYYLEIGGGHPIDNNNSYFFEKNLRWKGISLDLDPNLSRKWSSFRKNPLVIEDATVSNYSSLLRTFPRVIDYLSLDIDDNYDLVLQKIPFNEYIFKVITIEHDFYRHGEKYRDMERQILSSLGYYLLCPDVMILLNGKDCSFEDWWIYPDAFSDDLLSALTGQDLKTQRHDQLVNILKGLIKSF